MKAFSQFVLVSGVGFLVDIAIALLLRNVLGLPLWLAAAISFYAVACLNYLAFEYWVFRREGRALSMRRLLGVLGASSVAAVSRIATILALTPLALAQIAEPIARDIALLVAGAGISILVNFCVTKWLVFRPSAGTE